jgi:hypothetical protein
MLSVGKEVYVLDSYMPVELLSLLLSNCLCLRKLMSRVAFSNNLLVNYHMNVSPDR